MLTSLLLMKLDDLLNCQLSDYDNLFPSNIYNHQSANLGGKAARSSSPNKHKFWNKLNENMAERTPNEFAKSDVINAYGRL